jgi:hypothetical protein
MRKLIVCPSSCREVAWPNGKERGRLYRLTWSWASSLSVCRDFPDLLEHDECTSLEVVFFIGLDYFVVARLKHM